MRTWTVAGALIESPDGLLLVRNDRPMGQSDWSTPGGVIDADDDSLLRGLAREVLEETGLCVDAWSGPVYSVRAEAPALGWHMHCEVHLAAAYSGELTLADPDGIVVEAAFVGPAEGVALLAGARPWVREPLEEWLTARWEPGTVREFRYRVDGPHPADAVVTRLEP